MTDVAESVAKWLPLFVRPSDVVELRFLGVGRPGRIHAGWMLGRHVDALAKHIADKAAESEGAYFTPQILAPTAKRSPFGHFGPVRRSPDGKETVPRLTHDEDVTARRYLLIDVDPIRPKDTCATDDEKSSAFAVGDAVRGYLIDRYGEPLVVDSGNGVHLYFRLPEVVAVRDESCDLIGLFLKKLASKFNTTKAEIDCRVYNPSRIMKLPGTWSKKGPSSQGRPHRKSAVLSIPTNWRHTNGGAD